MTNLDKLTYAGNRASVADLEGDPRHRFVQGDICDPDQVAEAIAGHDVVVNFAAETHVDRSIVEPLEAVRTNTVGVATLAEAARSRRGRALPPGRHRRGVRDHQRRLVRRGRPAGAVLAVLGRQGRRLPGRPGLRRHPQAGRGRDPLHQQLRALPVPREGHPAVRHQPDGRPQGAAVRQRRQHPRLAVRARPLQRHRPGAAARPDRRHLQHRRRQRGHQPGADPAHPGRLRRRRGHDRVRGRPAWPRLALLAGHHQGPRARLGPGPRLRPGPGRDDRLVPRPRGLVAPDEARRRHPDPIRPGVRRVEPSPPAGEGPPHRGRGAGGAGPGGAFADAKELVRASTGPASTSPAGRRWPTPWPSWPPTWW